MHGTSQGMGRPGLAATAVSALQKGAQGYANPLSGAVSLPRLEGVARRQRVVHNTLFLGSHHPLSINGMGK